MSIIVALTVIFSDGYMDGSVHVRDFKTMQECHRYAPQVVRHYTAGGHPATYVCERAEKMVRKGPIYEHTVPTLPAG